MHGVRVRGCDVVPFEVRAATGPGEPANVTSASRRFRGFARTMDGILSRKWDLKRDRRRCVSVCPNYTFGSESKEN